MDVENIRHLILYRIPTRKEQHWNERLNKTRKQDYTEKKKNILKRIISETDKDLRILFSIKYRLDNKRKRKIEI